MKAFLLLNSKSFYFTRIAEDSMTLIVNQVAKSFSTPSIEEWKILKGKFVIATCCEENLFVQLVASNMTS